MSNYNFFERAIATVLDSSPRLKEILKITYQKVNYFFYKKDYSYELDSKCNMQLLSNDEGFFGYYERSCWHLSGNYVLYNKVVNNRLEVYVSDQKSMVHKCVYITDCWNYQQGALATWNTVPGTIEFFVNTIVGDELGCAKVALVGDSWEILDFYPYPLQCLSPDGRSYISLNYLTLMKLRPDYGYNVSVNNFSYPVNDDVDGLWSFDIATKSCILLISLSELKETNANETMQGARHKVNHAIYSRDGQKLLFMHRWIGSEGKFSRLLCLDLCTKALDIVLDDRMVSHYSWKNDNTFVAWARTVEFGDKYYVVDIKPRNISILEEVSGVHGNGDGHPSYSPCGNYIITDTYPGRDRMRNLVLYDVKHGNSVLIGRFLSPWKFDGEQRCDLHPRWSSDGKSVAIDTSHNGYRQLFEIDLNEYIKDSEQVVNL